MNGFLIRTKLTKKYAMDIWYDYSDTQRKFNGFDNQWDLCVAFDADGIPRTDGDSSGGCYDEDPKPWLPGPPVILHPSSHENRYLEDVKRFYETRYVNPFSHHHDTVQDTLYYRYGFFKSQDLPSTLVSDVVAVDRLMKTLAYGRGS